MLANSATTLWIIPKLSFEEIAKKLGVDFNKAKNGKYGRRNAGKFFERERKSMTVLEVAYGTPVPSLRSAKLGDH